MLRQAPPISEFDGLQVFMCGTSSPLPAPNRAQACVAVLAGESLYLVDAGAGSAQVASLAGLPLQRLEAVFLTHFHSDHNTLSLPIIKTLEEVSAGTRMERVFHDIQDYHAHADDLAALVEQSGVQQLAVYRLVPAPSNALFEKIYSRDLPDGTVVTEDGMIFELPAGSEKVTVIAS